MSIVIGNEALGFVERQRFFTWLFSPGVEELIPLAPNGNSPSQTINFAPFHQHQGMWIKAAPPGHKRVIGVIAMKKRKKKYPLSFRMSGRPNVYLCRGQVEAHEAVPKVPGKFLLAVILLYHGSGRLHVHLRGNLQKYEPLDTNQVVSIRPWDY